MKKEIYVIELENSEFAGFIQDDDTDLMVVSFDEANFHLADFMNKKNAYDTFDEMTNGNSVWNYFGECIIPKKVRKVIIELF